MTTFRAALVVAWLVVVAVTVHAVATLGAGGVSLFVTDLGHPRTAHDSPGRNGEAAVSPPSTVKH